MFFASLNKYQVSYFFLETYSSVLYFFWVYRRHGQPLSTQKLIVGGMDRDYYPPSAISTGVGTQLRPCQSDHLILLATDIG